MHGISWMETLKFSCETVQFHWLLIILFSPFTCGISFVSSGRGPWSEFDNIFYDGKKKLYRNGKHQLYILLKLCVCLQSFDKLIFMKL